MSRHVVQAKKSRGRLAPGAIEYLKEVSWAILLLCMVLVGFTYPPFWQAGYATMAWICLGFALLLIVVFGTIFGIKLIGALVIRAPKEFGRRKSLP